MKNSIPPQGSGLPIVRDDESGSEDIIENNYDSSGCCDDSSGCCDDSS